MPYPEYLYLSMSAFFVNLAAPKREFTKVMLESLVPGINL